MMTRQSMARVSSASPEADFAPATQTPFDWEAAPGRAARKTSKYGNSGNFSSADRDSSDADEGPSLPLPPGRRPKDGFFLPYSREFGDSPDLQSQSEVESGLNSSRPRKMFNLKFPGSARKPSSMSRMHLPFQRSSKPPKAREERREHEDPGFSIFNPLSGHRFGSSVANRMLMQFQKKQSLWRRCLLSKLEGEGPFRDSSSHSDPTRGRRLDEGLDEGYVTAGDSPTSRASLPSFPHHVHRSSNNSSPGATKPLQANSSRFMASMLISLCPDDAGGSDAAHHRAEDENSDDYNDEIGIPHTTSPTAKSSSPEAFEVEMDPASQTVAYRENFTCICKHRASNFAKAGSSTPEVYQRGKTSRSVTRSLHEQLAAASENSKGGKILQQGTRGAADKFNGSNATDQQDSADAYPVFFKASSNREFSRRRETFSWKPCTESNCSNQEPMAGLAASDTAREPKHSEFTEEPLFDDDDDDDDGEEYDRRERCSPRTQNFPAGSNRSCSPGFSSHKPAWPRLKSSSVATTPEVHAAVSQSNHGVSHSATGYLSPPRISLEDLEHTSNSDIKPMAFARWRSAADRSVMRRDSTLEAGGLERKQPPATRVALNSASPLQKQTLQQRTLASKAKIKDLQKTENFYSRPSKTLDTADTDESSDVESDYSTDSSESEIIPPAAGPSPVLPNFASPDPASPVLSERLFKFDLHSRQSQRESPRSASMVGEDTAAPGPSSEQITMARSQSVRSASSRRSAAPEFQAMTAAGPNFRRSNYPASASRLAKMSSSSVMSKVALFESKVSVSKSGPLSSSFT